jgi:hypothetical protein
MFLLTVIFKKKIRTVFVRPKFEVPSEKRPEA